MSVEGAGGTLQEEGALPRSDCCFCSLLLLLPSVRGSSTREVRWSPAPAVHWSGQSLSNFAAPTWAQWLLYSGSPDIDIVPGFAPTVASSLLCTLPPNSSGSCPEVCFLWLPWCWYRALSLVPAVAPDFLCRPTHLPQLAYPLDGCWGLLGNSGPSVAG